MQTVECPAAAVLDTWSNRDWREGLQLEEVPDLECLAIRTRNSLYEITILCGRTGDVMVRGGRFFPEFSRVRLAGSSLGGSILKLRGVYVGFRLELQLGRMLIITSPIQSIAMVPTSDRAQ